MTDVHASSATAPPAGWYPDPSGEHEQRWWTGQEWTSYVDDPESPPLETNVSAGPVADLAPPADVGAAVGAPRLTETPEQSQWHAKATVPVRRGEFASPSLSSPAVARSLAESRRRNPYDRNWIAILAAFVAVLSVPALAARVMWDLPPLTQSIFAGAPLGISLLALAGAVRGRSGLITSLAATVLSGAMVAIGYFVDPEVLRGIVSSVLALVGL
ncbi:MAG TPA: DUF2510 domain-containing protein [Pseudolysinimonas sp.]|nr:DUF2510 domain-containing protein [Pseudolysinimonas sp.]